MSFALRKGEILGFAGLMGAGRTEVARAIFGADPVDSGEIRSEARRSRSARPADAVAHGIGYLSEDRKHFGLATGLDVETNIVLASMRRFLALGFVLKRPASATPPRASSSGWRSRPRRSHSRSRCCPAATSRRS